MKVESIIKKAKMRGMVVDYRRYGYYDHVLHLNGTAVCFDYTAEDGSFSIMSGPDCFPPFVTIKYILEAAENGAPNLGAYREKSTFGLKKWRAWNERYDLYELNPWPRCQECGAYFEQHHFAPTAEVLRYTECPDCRESTEWHAGYCSLGATCALKSLNWSAWEIRTFPSKAEREAWLETAYDSAWNVVGRKLYRWEVEELRKHCGEE